MGPSLLTWLFSLLGPGDVQILEEDASFDGLPPIVAPMVFEIPRPGRVLRGDWETPDEVAMVFTVAWPQTSRRLAEAIAPSTRVIALHEDDTSFRDLRHWWRGLDPNVRDRVEILDVQVNSPWIRDYGPFQARERDGSLTWIDAGYDDQRTRDDSLPSVLGERRPARVDDYPDWIEGGAFISNGKGLCAAALEYFDLRGPSVKDEAGMQELQRKLGCQVLALFPTLTSEPTNHADMVAQFLSPTRVLIAYAEGEGHDARILAQVEATLAGAAARMGKQLEFVRVPVRYSTHGDFRSYVNGLQLAGHFVMPQYGRGDALDRQAAAAIEAGSPGIQVVPLGAKVPASNGGAVHCMTLGLETPPAEPPRPRARTHARAVPPPR